MKPATKQIATLGIDLAKRIFALHGVDVTGAVVLRCTIGRAQLLDFVAGLPPCTVGMEACSGSHEWARRFQAFGHTVRLIAPAFVTPYRKSGKNDANEPPRDSRRLHYLRGWSHEQEDEVFAGGSRASRAAGV